MLCIYGMRSMDWTLTGVLGGVAILAVTAGYGVSAIVRSSPEPAKQVRATPGLIPTPDRPVLKANPNASAAGYPLQSNAPPVADAPAPQVGPPQVSSAAGSFPTASRVDTLPPLTPPVAGRPKDHAPPPVNP